MNVSITRILYVLMMLCTSVVAVYCYRRFCHTISYKMGAQHMVLALIVSIYIFMFPGYLPAWGICLADSLFLYFTAEQVLTGHTIYDFWEKKYWTGIVMIFFYELLFLGLTGNVLGCLIISRITYLGLCIADYYVLKARGTEIELADLSALGTAASVAGNYKLRLTGAVIGSVILSAVQIWLENTAWSGSLMQGTLTGKCRIIYVILYVIVFSLFLFTPFLEKLGITYYEFLNIDGVVLNLLLEKRDNMKDQTPDDYSADEIVRIAERYSAKESDRKHIEADGIRADGIKADDAKKTGQKSEGLRPNIIVIMNEAFSDLRIHGKLDTDREIMPFLDGCKDGHITGSTCVSILGGNTAYSEYEFLTGDSTIDYHYCPYSSKVIKPGMNVGGIVSHMKSLDYRTIAAHSYRRENWRRPIVYEAMGFDEQYYIDDFDKVETIRSFASDRCHYDQIIKLFKEKKPGERLFDFNVTMQNHGGYRADEQLDNRIHLMGHPGEFGDVETYLTLISESDKAIQYLTEYFRDYPEPTIIYMFGDHQPKCPDLFFEEMYGRPASQLSFEERINAYVTPYHVFMNEACGTKWREKPEYDKISLNYAGSYLCSLAGLPKTGYMRYLDDLQKGYPVISKREIADISGRVFEPERFMSSVQTQQSESDENGNGLIKEYERVMYSHIFAAQGRADSFFG